MGKKGRKNQNVDDMYITADPVPEQKAPAQPAQPEQPAPEPKKEVSQPQSQPQPKQKKQQQQQQQQQKKKGAATPATPAAPASAPAQEKEKEKEETPAKTAETDEGKKKVATSKKQQQQQQQGGKKGINNAVRKAMTEAILKQKQEEERLRKKRAEELRRLREEEKRQEEEEKKRQAAAEEQRRKRRIANKAKAEEEKKRQEEERHRLALAKLGLTEEDVQRKIEQQRKLQADRATKAKANKKKYKEEKAAAVASADKAADNTTAEENSFESWEDFVGDDDNENNETNEKTTEEEKEEEKKVSEEEEKTAATTTTRTAAAAAVETSAGATTTTAGGKILRSPICSVLGHVDVGKTKLLDKIRRTNVQTGEAGGITQQIGASYFPIEKIQRLCSGFGDRVRKLQYKVPGLLIIDTPGHESFSNLRSRGSSLCDIAILVVDIMHGIEPMTIESIKMLRARKTPFVVALNKIDRLHGWEATPFAPFTATFAKQNEDVKNEFERRLGETIVGLNAQSLNAMLYTRTKTMSEMREYVQLVPTSAITGEGIPDLLMLVVQLTQNLMERQLYFDATDLRASVLEVKADPGYGACIDVILVNGMLRSSDRICVCGKHGPIVTDIRSLLTPEALRDIRVKTKYTLNKEVRAAMGVRIAAAGLEDAVAGSSLYTIPEGATQDEIEDIKEETQKDLKNLQGKLDTTGVGVTVHASTLGALEALLSFLKDSKIPVASINIGPVYKKSVIFASIMHDKPEASKYAVILSFDVSVDKEAIELSAKSNVKIFTADIIYHLFDQFTAHMKQLEEEEKRNAQKAGEVIWPVELEILPQFIINNRNPIILGCTVKEGELRLGTPIVAVVPKKDPSAGTAAADDDDDEGTGAAARKKKDFGKQFFLLGRVTSIESNNHGIEKAKKVNIYIYIHDFNNTT